MKWNIEWIDLQNIEHMIAECWRMNDKQLKQYFRKLSERRDLEFAGALGLSFLQLMYGIIMKESSYGWSELQKDVHMLQKLIQDGIDKDEDYWKGQYREIADEPTFYFYTELGKSFTDQLAVKLELNISNEQKLLQQDIQMIEKVCRVCDFKKESDVQKALLILKNHDKNYFSSWLGESFMETLQERFLKKEKPALEPTEVLEPQQVREPLEQKRRRSLFKKNKTGKEGARKRPTAIRNIFLCLAFLAGGAAVYTQLAHKQVYSCLKQLRPSVKETTAKQDAQKGQVSVADHTPDRTVEVTALEQQRSKNAAPEVSALEQQQSKNAAPEVSALEQQQLKDAAPDDASGKNATEDGQPDSDAQNQMQSEGRANSELKAPDILGQYQSFCENYPDVFGWLKIPGTEIDVPVMQSDDEEKGEKYYYLHRDYTGKPSAEGSLFVDSKSGCYPQDDNTVIYGHNMNSGHIFGTLEKFMDYDYFREHQDIQYDTIYETGQYRVVAVLKTRILYQDEEGFRYYRFFHYDTQEEFQECLAFINRNKLFDTGEELRYGDQTIMLSTCEYSQENGRLVVVAKRVDN